MDGYSIKQLFLDIWSDAVMYGGNRRVLVLPKLIWGRSFHLLLLHRISRYLYLKGIKGSGVLIIILRYMQQMFCNCEIAPTALLGRNIRFSHPIGIVIGEQAIIKDNVAIFQQVTVGSHGRKGEEASYPTIEEGVTIYAGAKVIGDIRVGRNAIIGANSVVIRNVPDEATVVGIPAREITHGS